MLKVFIVDDDAEMRFMEEKLLKDTFEVRSFASGPEFLVAIETDKPDVVLLDIEMPTMSGHDVLNRLSNSGIIVIGVTGHNDRVTILKFISAGADGYILKPPTKGVLVDTIDKCVQKRKEAMGRKNILIVDDDAQSLMMYKMVLEKDYNVIALNASLAAKGYLEKNKPDMVILDYNMPIYNGRFLLEAIRRSDNNANVPVILLTSERDNSVLFQCMAFHPEAIVRKSEGKMALVKSVQSVFENVR